MEPDELDKQLTELDKQLTEYRNWGSTRTRVITGIVFLLILAGIVAWLIIGGHPLPGGGGRF